MSDELIFVAMFCITALTIASMFFFSTYNKEKLQLKSKTNIKDLIDAEIIVTAEDEE